MGDVRTEIDEALSAPAEVSLPISATAAVLAANRSARLWRSLALALLVIGAFGIAIVWWMAQSQPATAPRVIRFTLPIPASPGTMGRQQMAISADGARIVHRSAEGLTLNTRDRLSAITLTDVGTFPSGPFFSPDGEWIGYTDGPVLRKVSIAGGSPIDIADVGPGAIADWRPEGIAFADVRGLFLLRAERSTPEQLSLSIDATEQATVPELLPGGRAVLYTVIPTRSIVAPNATSIPGARIEVLNIDSGMQTTLMRGGSHARYLPTGHLIYVAQETLYAVAFDLQRLAPQGNPVQIVNERVAEFAVSDEGTLVYAPSTRRADTTVVWVDRHGRVEALGTPPRAYLYPRLSPDGTRVALDVRDTPDRDIWMWDLRRKTLERFTVDPAGNPLMAWSPDGRRLVFGSDRFGATNLFVQAADGSGNAERLLVSDRIQMPLSFAPDGRLLFSEEVPGQGRNVQALSLDGSRRVDALTASAANELNAEVSPDGKLLAYDSNESGQFEIYVRPYPNVSDSRWKVSVQGGRQPLWSPDGRELFYRDFSGAVMSARVASAPTFMPGEVTKIIDGAGYEGSGAMGGGRTYDVSRDGQRFLLIKSFENSDPASTSFVVVVNWPEELRQRGLTR